MSEGKETISPDFIGDFTGVRPGLDEFGTISRTQRGRRDDEDKADEHGSNRGKISQASTGGIWCLTKRQAWDSPVENEKKGKEREREREREREGASSSGG